MYRLYVVEDDASLRALLAENLVRYGYEVQTSRDEDFPALDRVVREFDPHLILLDINLPFYDGFFWARRFRLFTRAPILFLSVRGDPMDTVRALENGGDDYLVKPFHLDVLLAKVEALLRRAYGELAGVQHSMPSYGGLTVRVDRQEALYGDRRVSLTPTETRLLAALLMARGAPVSRDELMFAAWDNAEFLEDNTLTVNVARLRLKLAELGLEGALRTVRGFGYRIALSGEEDANAGRGKFRGSAGRKAGGGAVAGEGRKADAGD
ncbi:MAG: Two-component response regulator YvcP [Brockia lithotrophica]|uniref:Two-component response regulator YvcP n=1 Tax=Brockia lithotrophica TaxID=933949 RepID=A0A2T5G8R2_9BACL|nr:response regulator transcription factor [Brockia lithotrophica]MBT9252680.1 response regulator transcription factor [Brockia lithotrophica]PTQ52583.1 MAG: Two-component response regulator YvcP [Brockia lithotrophica]